MGIRAEILRFFAPGAAVGSIAENGHRAFSYSTKAGTVRNLFLETGHIAGEHTGSS